MALVLDTGPLFAALDRDDAAHATCRRLFQGTTEPMVIPSPVLAEVDYWVRQRLHPGIFTALLRDIEDGAFRVEDVRAGDLRRIRTLCEQYSDAELGFVDAAVIAIVERLNEPKLATLDRRHFSLVRPNHVAALSLLPD